MWEPLIMQEPLIMREPESGHSWTSKVFNTVITLDTYQFDIFLFVEIIFEFDIMKNSSPLNLKFTFFATVKTKKLIGVQSNHGVEYFGGPAAPTQRFPRFPRFPHNQQFFHNSELL